MPLCALCALLVVVVTGDGDAHDCRAFVVARFGVSVVYVSCARARAFAIRHPHAILARVTLHADRRRSADGIVARIFCVVVVVLRRGRVDRDRGHLLPGSNVGGTATELCRAAVAAARCLYALDLGGIVCRSVSWCPFFFPVGPFYRFPSARSRECAIWPIFDHFSWSRMSWGTFDSI
jgi:hypothetical protein